MIGDPSGEGLEYNLLSTDTLYHSQEAIRQQMLKFPNSDGGTPNKVELVGSRNWTRNFTFLDLTREVDRHIIVSYMMAEGNVEKRLGGEASDGLSFAELTYQLLQGCDFLHLYQKRGIKL